MTEIDHRQIAQYLTDQPTPSNIGVYLVHGQEMLVEQSVELLLKHLVGKEDRELCCQVVPGVAENVPDVLEQMNTFSLLSGPKIVLFKDAKLFDARGGQQQLVDHIADAHEAGNMAQAAKKLLQLCGLLGIDLEDVLNKGRSNAILKSLFSAVGDQAVQPMVDYCIAKSWQPLPSTDAVGALLQAIEKGFPENHHLIVAANAKVPKNLKFYKGMAKSGLIVDCNVAMGERHADKIAQDKVLRQSLDQQLAEAGKKLMPGLFQTLCRLTGFDLRTFSQNVEKLVDYIGTRSEITADDIHHVLRRTKSDPIFELTNAVADRNLVQALFFLNTLLMDKWHPLQILSAITNQVRKLLVAKDFATRKGSTWSTGMDYQQFQRNVMPAIQAYDAANREVVLQWRPENHTPQKGKKGKGKGVAEVVLAPNPKSAYPVYQTLLKSEKYTMGELVDAMALISKSDVCLKSTGQDPVMVIKKTISDICSGGRFSPSD